MKYSKNIQPVDKPLWFTTWFDSAHYHTLYAHRSDDEAAAFITALVSELNPGFNASAIDVGCGSGRHCRQLAAKGLNVTGIDLAFSSIKRAKRHELDTLRFFQHDMRFAFGKSCFDYVLNFFTSFGYFKNPAENETVIGNMAKALKPGGTLVIDYLNVSYAESSLINREHKEIDGTIYHIRRWMDANFFYKEISFEDKFVAQSLEYVEQVAKFSLEDFKEMFTAAGLELTKVFGDYSLGDYNIQESPRMILVAEKKD